MITKLTSTSRKPKLLIIAVVALAVIGVGAFLMFGLKKSSQSSEYPLYMNFAGNYAFTVPAEYRVDEQSVPGSQLVYSGSFAVKTLADIYDAGGTSVQGLSDLTDKNFKEYVNDTFIPNFKKDAGTEDVQVKYGKEDGVDVARVTAKKDGNDFRFFYLKGGKHPVVLVAKDENDILKGIVRTLKGVEDSALKGEIDPIKDAIKSATELARDQKVDELYDSAAPELRAQNSKEELSNALKTSADYLKGNVTISGGSLDDGQGFSAAMRFTKLEDTEQKEPAFGSLALKKVDGQWKVEMLTLPSPSQE